MAGAATFRPMAARDAPDLVLMRRAEGLTYRTMTVDGVRRRVARFVASPPAIDDAVRLMDCSGRLHLRRIALAQLLAGLDPADVAAPVASSTPSSSTPSVTPVDRPPPDPPPDPPALCTLHVSALVDAPTGPPSPFPG